MNTLLRHYLRFFIILVMFFPLVSCEENENDELLKAKIIGTWKSTNSYYKSFTFFDNNIFIDSAFVLNDENPSSFKVSEVISGEYTIHDGLLMLSNINLVYVEGQDELLGFSTTYDATYIISFDVDILVLNQKDVFNPLGNRRSEIVGKWTHNKLIAALDRSTEKIFTGGLVKGTYEFKPDLSVTWQYKSLYDNVELTGGSTATYELVGSNLNISNWSLHNLAVSFSKGNMVWIYGDKTFQRIQ